MLYQFLVELGKISQISADPVETVTNNYRNFISHAVSEKSLEVRTVNVSTGIAFVLIDFYFCIIVILGE